MSDRYEDLRAFLDRAELSDDRVFAEAVSLVVETFGLPLGELGNALSVSRPTISRWMDGKTAPHPAMREPVRTFARRRLETLARQKKPVHRFGAPRASDPAPAPAGSSERAVRVA